MISPFVSIIITTHNRPILVRRAIDSAFSQTYSNKEIIVVDDASDKETQMVCSQYKNIKYHYIPIEESKGGNYARNLGIKVSKGEYVSLLDDDDYWLPDKISKQVTLLEKNNRCSVCYTNAYSEEVLPDGSTKLKEFMINPELQGDMHDKIWTCLQISTSKLMFRRDILFQAGLFDEDLKYWQDIELLIRLSQITHFLLCSEALTIYRDDKKEKKRLSNNYYEWKKAIKYINYKHQEILANTPIDYRLGYKTICCYDGYQRAKRQGIFFEYLKLRIKTCILFRFRKLIQQVNKLKASN